jgi:hypothetical protein
MNLSGLKRSLVCLLDVQADFIRSQGELIRNLHPLLTTHLETINKVRSEMDEHAANVKKIFNEHSKDPTDWWKKEE